MPLFNRRPRHAFRDDEVVVYKFGSCSTSPTKSPFTLKLETYLRLAKIPYKTLKGHNLSSKGKIPWMSHKNTDIADSQFSIEYLNREFGVDLNKDLTDTDKAMARAMRKMVEDSLYWYLVVDRWKYQADRNWVLDMNVNSCFAIWAKKRASTLAYGHGIGRHEKDEVYAIAIADARALSSFLGDKSFFFGDAPVEEDSAIFGQLCCIIHSLYGGVISNYIKDELPNLVAYCERMKALAWPDWEELLTKRQK